MFKQLDFESVLHKDLVKPEGRFKIYAVPYLDTVPAKQLAEHYYLASVEFSEQIDPTGTSYFDDQIVATLATLEKTIGKAHYRGSVANKIQREWDFAVHRHTNHLLTPDEVYQDSCTQQKAVHSIYESYCELLHKYGNPDRRCSIFSYHPVTTYWSDEVHTLYDWKLDWDYPDNTMIQWHLGRKNRVNVYEDIIAAVATDILNVEMERDPELRGGWDHAIHSNVRGLPHRHSTVKQYTTLLYDPLCPNT